MGKEVEHGGGGGRTGKSSVRGKERVGGRRRDGDGDSGWRSSC